MNDSQLQAIAAELERAAEHDVMARQARKRAGQLLAELQASGAYRNRAWRAIGLDDRTVSLLIEIGAGAVPASAAR